jgi:excisionase family DNA binding protein
MEKLVYTVNEMAKALNIGMNSAYCLVNSKDFPKLQVGRKILIPKKSLERWVESTSKSTI